jgi:nucleoside-diphosphate-sugar epimerase
MNILLTGSSGFLGSQIKSFCESKHTVITIGRQVSNDIICDLATQNPQLDNIDAVIHAAGKAHVYPETEAEKQAFFDVNVTGAKHLLESLEHVSVRKFIFVSSVSVYGLGQGEEIAEETPLKGNSPYALSKIQAEQLIVDWCNQKQIPYLIVRLPLVVGPNPLGNLGKMIEAIQRGRYVRIAKGNARKSMVLASDVALLFERWLTAPDAISGIYNLTDGHHPTFYELEEALKVKYNKKSIPTIPAWLANFMGKMGDRFSFFPVNSQTIQKITCTFTFSDAKAQRELQWKPSKVLDYYTVPAR